MKMDVITVVKRRPVVFPLILAVALSMLLISEGSYHRSVGMLDDLVEMSQARSAVHAVQQGMLEAETARLVHAATGNAEDLRLREIALKRVEQSFVQLERLHAGQPKPLAVLQRMRREAALLLSDPSQPGTQAIDGLRASSAELLQLEEQRSFTSREDLSRSLLLGRVGVALLSAVSLLALFMYLRQSFALEAQTAELQQRLQLERTRLERQVAQRTEQLTELTQHLQTAREDERNRLARDLHDELGALLTSAKLDAARIRSRLAGSAPEALERLAHLVATLDAVIALKRRITEDLRPSSLTPLGLMATLEILAREFTESAGIAVHCELAPVRLAPSAELVVYRLVQEAFTNLSKYAGATQVWLTMSTRGDRVEVTVRDDGAGFDPAAVRRSAHGLLGMRYRVEAEQGTMTLLSTPGRGTLIAVSLPAAPALRADATLTPA